MQQVIKELIRSKAIQSAHDVADGGLYIALLEAAMPLGLGFEISTDADIRKDAFLFGEAQGRVVVSVSPEEQERFTEIMATSNVEYTLLGNVTGDGNLTVDEELYGNVTDIKLVYDNVLHVALGE